MYKEILFKELREQDLRINNLEIHKIIDSKDLIMEMAETTIVIITVNNTGYLIIIICIYIIFLK